MSGRAWRALAASSWLALLLVTGAMAEILADPVTYRKENRGGYEQIIFTNSCAVPVTIKLNLKLRNTAVEGPSDLIELPAHGVVRGPVFRSAGAGDWKYSWTYRYNFGSYRVREASEPFDLPWAEGETFVTGQAFSGKKSHTGEDRFAVDFPMPEGTPVHAARAGLVCYVREEYSEGGWRRELRDRDNHVIIAHQDGTMSRYLHLRKNGAAVDLGDWVETGDLIGYSGNVGYSNGPHLHFDVVRPGTDLVTQTIPFELLYEGIPIEPVEDLPMSH